MVKKQQKTNSSSRSIQQLVLLFLIVALLSVGVTFFLLKVLNPVPDEVRYLAYDFKVQEEIGFVLDNDILHFGGGPPTARLQRSINVSTTKDARVRIDWDGPGDIKVSENDFDLEANTIKLLTFYVDIPLNASYGLYEGMLIFSFYR